MQILETRDRARSVLLDFCWGQWVQLGVSGERTSTDHWAIDPEALLLLTVEVARRDPRLFDEVLDWVSRHSSLLSAQRLRNLGPRFPIDLRLTSSLLAFIGGSQHDDRGEADDPTAARRALFAPDVLSYIRHPDPGFARHGLLRPRIRLSGKSASPNPEAPINLCFRLRLLFGTGSRSEVIRILLTRLGDPLDGAAVADEAGFAKRNVSDVLGRLVEAGLVDVRWAGNERIYAINQDRAAGLLGSVSQHPPTFVSWVHLLPALTGMLGWLEREAGDEVTSGYIRASRARDLMERIGSDLEMAGVTGLPRRPLPGAAYLPPFMDLIDSLLDSIRSGVLGANRLASVHPRSRGQRALTDRRSRV